MSAEAGEKAPGFKFPTDRRENEVSLDAYTREGSVALFFNPGGWSSVCTHQMGLLQAEIGRFEEKGACLLSVEGYGARYEDGYPEGGYFIFDREGVIRAGLVESSTREQPEVEAVHEDLARAL